MKYEEIETFLAVVDCGSIGKAADLLFVSQGTASTRLKQLEDELDVQLLIRQKGHRKVRLTESGEEFLPIAQQWYALWYDAINLKNLQSYRELRIGASDLINTCTFTGLYRHFIENNQEIVLNLKTHHSHELFREIDNQLCDIGFCTNIYDYPNIIVTPIFDEKLVLLCHKKNTYAVSKNVNDLAVQSEIYLNYSKEYARWHKSVFGTGARFLVSVGTVQMITNFLGDRDKWAMVPMSLAVLAVKANSDLVYLEMKENPPVRKVYLLTYKYPKPGIKRATQIFIGEVMKFIATSNGVLAVSHID